MNGLSDIDCLLLIFDQIHRNHKIRKITFDKGSLNHFETALVRTLDESSANQTLYAFLTLYLCTLKQLSQ